MRSKRRILVIEDTLEDRGLVRRYLASDPEYSNQITEAESGEAGIALACSTKFDAILLDQALPGMGGLEVLRALCKGRSAPPLPVVFLTGEAEGSAAQQALSAGAHDYLIKDEITPRGLGRALTNATIKHRLAAQAALAAQRSRHLQEIAAALSLSVTPEQAIEVILGRAVTATGAAAAVLWFLDERARMLEMVTSPGFSEDDIAGWKQIPLEADVPIAEAVREGRAVFCSDRAERHRRWPLLMNGATDEGARASLPLVVSGSCFGGLGLAFPEAMAFSDEDRRFLELLARQCSQALERARLYRDEKRARQELRESEARYRALVTASAQIIWRSNAEGVSNFVAPGWEELTGQSAAQFFAYGWAERIHPADKERVLAAWRQDLRAGRSSEREFRLLDCEGNPRVVHVRAVPVRDDTGAIREWIGTTDDVTEQRKAEDARRSSEARLRDTLKDAAAGTWEWDLLSNELTWAPEQYLLYGLDPADGIDFARWERCVHPGDLAALNAAAREAIAGRGPEFRGEFRIDHPKLGVRWLLAVARIERAVDGAALRARGLNIDITQRKQTEEELLAARFRLEAALENSTVVVFEQDLELRYTWIQNPALVGYEAQQFIGQRDGDIFERPGDAVATEALKREALATGERRRGEVVVAWDGIEHSYDLAVEPKRGPDGAIVGVVCVAVDVTVRKRAEDERRNSEESARRQANELKVVLDAVPSGVFIARDRAAAQVEANRFGYQMLRMSPGSNVSKSAPEGEKPQSFRTMKDGVEIPPDQLPVQVAAATGREVRNYECDILFEDGESRRLLGNASPLVDAEGEPTGAVGAFVDITDQYKLQKELREADLRKNEFLAVLGHELRNPLAPIRTAVELMKLRQSGGARERGVIERQVAHLSRLVDDLLDVSRIASGKIELSKSVVEVAEFVGMAVETVSPLLEKRRQELSLDLPAAGLPVLGDRARLAQVASNLLINASKFTRAGGHLWVTARQEGREAVLSVRDDGIGIAPEMLPRLFDAFMQIPRTLDRADGGLGLGLALVRDLLALHGGSVVAQSDGIGRGSVFSVRLPLLASDAPLTVEATPKLS